MAGTEIIDLDELLGADKRVKLAGKVYTLPPDLPAELYLTIIRLARENPSEAEMIEALYDQLLGLFRYKDPKLESLPLTIQQCTTAVARIYGDQSDQEQTRPPRTRGGANGRRAARS